MLKKDNIKLYNLLFWAVCLFIFVLMLWCNIKTPLLCDDYRYLFTFSTDGPIKRVESLWEIFPSMAAHRLQMNGRVLPHFVVQLSLMLPLWVFDIVNSAVFLLMLLLIEKCAFSGSAQLKKAHPVYRLLLFTGMFAAIWLLEPSFGQVNLWQDGAVNYLWSAALALVPIYLFLRLLLSGEYCRSIPGIAALAAVCFACGAWSENAAGAVLIFVVFILLYEMLIKKQKIHWSFWLYLAAIVAGFVYMVSSPAEFTNKVAEDMSIFEPIWRLPRVFLIFSSFSALWIVAAVLLTCAVLLKANRECIFAAGLLLLCAVAASFCLTLGNYIAERSIFFTVTMMVLCCALLLTELLGHCRVQIFCLLVVLLLYLPGSLLLGIIDIGSTYTAYMESEARIYEAVASGQTEFSVGNIAAATKHCALYGLFYVDTESPNNYPNGSMAMYYGLDKLYGY